MIGLDHEAPAEQASGSYSSVIQSASAPSSATASSKSAAHPTKHHAHQCGGRSGLSNLRGGIHGDHGRTGGDADDPVRHIREAHFLLRGVLLKMSVQKTLVHQRLDYGIHLVSAGDFQRKHRLILNVRPSLGSQSDAAPAVLASYHHLAELGSQRSAAGGALQRSHTRRSNDWLRGGRSSDWSWRTIL